MFSSKPTAREVQLYEQWGPRGPTFDLSSPFDACRQIES